MNIQLIKVGKKTSTEFNQLAKVLSEIKICNFN